MATRALAPQPVIEDRHDERHLVVEARARNARAFELLYRAHCQRAYATALRLLRDRTRAEEVVQDAFVRAWDSLPSFRGDSAFGSWLHRITVRAACDRVRQDDRRPRSIDDDAVAARYVAEARRAMPDARVDLERAIATLPAGARVVLLLHDVEGYRHDEIAEHLGVAVGTVKSQLHRARRLIAAQLER
jgi:RNA polymerase sigma-70 factor (ECF subfamily)